MIFTAEQLRAARALLRIDQRELARLSGVSIPTIQRLETQHGPIRANTRTVAKLQHAIEKAGAKFTERGVELSH